MVNTPRLVEILVGGFLYKDMPINFDRFKLPTIADEGKGDMEECHKCGMTDERENFHDSGLCDRCEDRRTETLEEKD